MREGKQRSPQWKAGYNAGYAAGFAEAQARAAKLAHLYRDELKHHAFNAMVDAKNHRHADRIFHMNDTDIFSMVQAQESAHMIARAIEGMERVQTTIARTVASLRAWKGPLRPNGSEGDDNGDQNVAGL